MTASTPSHEGADQRPSESSAALEHSSGDGHMDGVAVAALVSGILGLGVVPLVLGILGVRRTRTTGRGGRGLAIAGIVLGSVALTAGLVSVVIGALTPWPGTHSTANANVTPAAGATWFEFQASDGKLTNADLAAAADVFRARLAGRQGDVTVKGRAVRVSFAAASSSDVLSALTAPASVEFRPVLEVDDPHSAASSAPPRNGSQATPSGEPSSPSDVAYYLTADVMARLNQLDCTSTPPPAALQAPTDGAMVACAADGSEKYALGPEELDGKHLASVSSGVAGADKHPIISLTFDAQGTTQLAATTTRLYGQNYPLNRFAILLDGRVVTAPTVNGVIPNGQVEMSGSYTTTTAAAQAATFGFGRGGMTWHVTSSGS